MRAVQAPAPGLQFVIEIFNYVETAALAREMTSLFTKGWQFAAMADELANDQDFVCFELIKFIFLTEPFMIQCTSYLGGKLRLD